jgi:dTDP-glucose 4,6-dehydratase
VKKVLVTGGAGFIGSNFVRHLLDHDSEAHVVNLDLLTYAGNLDNLHGLPDPDRYDFVHGDICDKGLLFQIFEKYAIDAVVHFAAETHVDRSILGPAPFVQTNVVGTLALLETARESWSISGQIDPSIYHFHHISTDEVYGSLSPEAPAFTEQSPYEPKSPYAASKASSDHLVRAFSHTYGLPVTITNCSNNYGPYQFPEKLIPLVIFNAMSGKPIPIYGDGGQIRDWLYVIDHCDAIFRIMRDGQVGETYNIGGGNQPTNIFLVELICDLLDELLSDSPFLPHRSLISFVDDRPGHDRRYAMDITKIGSELGWEPKETLESGLKKTLDWYLSNSAWVSGINERPSYQDWIEKNYSERGEGE